MSLRIPAKCRPQMNIRWFLLGLILLTFLRLTWQLDVKALWWDESLSLQRAESEWIQLFMGTLILTDGQNSIATTDQHPFFFFMILGVLVRLAGESEFVLRFPSVMASTLLVPTVRVFSCALCRRRIVASTAPIWGSLLAAISPFYLWYGQEARPYALWAWLALFTTYLLWRALCGEDDELAASEDGTGELSWFTRFGQTTRWLGSRWGIGYGISLICFLGTHYFAFFLIPLHALLIWTRVMRIDRRMALLLAGLMFGAGAAAAVGIGWYLLTRTGGENFDRIPVAVLLPDLLNAFSMGLSVNINQIWWLDLVMGSLAAVGAIWAPRSRNLLREQGWIVGALVLVPVLVLLTINAVQPAYMNARHMSLISGGYVLAVGAGLGLLWTLQRGVALVIFALILWGSGYSTLNYFTVQEYDKDDFRGLAAYFRDQMQTGDLILLHPAASRRLFTYYLPLERIDSFNQQSDLLSHNRNRPDSAYFGVPLLHTAWEDQVDQLAQWGTQFRRIWLIRSGTFPFADPDSLVEEWMNEHFYRISEKRFFSHSALRASLFMPAPPVYNEPIEIRGLELSVLFGDQIRLVGIDISEQLTSESPLPVTLYWQTVSDTDVRYKYVLQLVNRNGQNGSEVLGRTEREPYDGTIATEYWASHQTIVEYTEIPLRQPLKHEMSQFEIHLQLYPISTQEKLSASAEETLPAGATVAEDQVTLIIAWLAE